MKTDKYNCLKTDNVLMRNCLEKDFHTDEVIQFGSPKVMYGYDIRNLRKYKHRLFRRMFNISSWVS